MTEFDPYIEEKVWGKVQHIFCSPYAAVSCLQVKQGYCCSIHYHEDRVNVFNVLEGSIVVEMMGYGIATNPGPIKGTILRAGDTFEVGASFWHRFRVLRSGRVVEVYYPAISDEPNVRIDDIVRWDQGGPDPDVFKEYQDALVEG